MMLLFYGKTNDALEVESSLSRTTTADYMEDVLSLQTDQDTGRPYGNGLTSVTGEAGRGHVLRHGE